MKSLKNNLYYLCSSIASKLSNFFEDDQEAKNSLHCSEYFLRLVPKNKIKRSRSYQIQIVSIALIFFLGIQQGSTQTASQFNSWYMYFGNHNLTDKISLHTEYQFRRHGLIEDWQQSLARIGLDYKLTEQSMLTSGYAWIVSFPYGEQPIPLSFDEHRIWQQVITTQKIKFVSLQHRYRLEQRFLQNVSTNANNEKQVEGYRFRQRARYRIMATIPLSRKSLEDNTLFFAAYEEAFLGFGEGIGTNILDQNRLYAALGWRFDASSNIQIGYLFHKIFKADGIQQENNHTFQLAWTKNLDLRKHVD